ICAVVRTTDAAASVTIAFRRGSVRPRRDGSGGYAGTAITPAYKQPKNAAMYSMDGGYSSTARSPAVVRSTSSPAIARARASSSAYVTIVGADSGVKSKNVNAGERGC